MNAIFLSVTHFLNGVNMKLLAAIVLSGVVVTASWADTVKITIERASAAPTSYSVDIGQSRVFDGMQMQAITPTSGDCSMVDTSKLVREAKHGELLRVRTSRMVDGHVLVARQLLLAAAMKRPYRVGGPVAPVVL